MPLKNISATLSVNSWTIWRPEPHQEVLDLPTGDDGLTLQFEVSAEVA
jgi:hypothetical protein